MSYANDKQDMVGRTFGRLKVVSLAGSRREKGLSRRLWSCECTCGNTTIVDTRSLTTGNTRSCGCLLKEAINKPRLDSSVRSKHEHLRRVWSGIKQRCYNKKNPEYKNYGGRGIKVYDGWLKKSKAFIDWCLNNGYEIGLDIDRINNDGNYEPSNCQFLTRSENTLKEKKKIIIAGIPMRYAEICNITGHSKNYFSKIIVRHGFTKAYIRIFEQLVFNIA